MTRAELLRIIRTLPSSTFVADQIQPPEQYKSHKEHWTRWLEEYDGPGYYGRNISNRDAKFVYNHIQNVGMLIWLAEAVKIDREFIWMANQSSMIVLNDKPAYRCRVIRKRLPWSAVQFHIENMT